MEEQPLITPPTDTPQTHIPPSAIPPPVEVPEDVPLVPEPTIKEEIVPAPEKEQIAQALPMEVEKKREFKDQIPCVVCLRDLPKGSLARLGTRKVSQAMAEHDPSLQPHLGKGNVLCSRHWLQLLPKNYKVKCPVCKEIKHVARECVPMLPEKMEHFDLEAENPSAQLLCPQCNARYESERLECKKICCIFSSELEMDVEVYEKRLQDMQFGENFGMVAKGKSTFRCGYNTRAVRGVQTAALLRMLHGTDPRGVGEGILDYIRRTPAVMYEVWEGLCDDRDDECHLGGDVPEPYLSGTDALLVPDRRNRKHNDEPQPPIPKIMQPSPRLMRSPVCSPISPLKTGSIAVEDDAAILMALASPRMSSRTPTQEMESGGIPRTFSTPFGLDDMEKDDHLVPLKDIEMRVIPVDPLVFVRWLRSWRRDKGLPHVHIPQIGGRLLDIHLLYREVTARGGLAEVMRLHQWGGIHVRLNLKISKQRSLMLRKHYSRILLAFEGWHWHGVSDDNNAVLQIQLKNWSAAVNNTPTALLDSSSQASVMHLLLPNNSESSEDEASSRTKRHHQERDPVRRKKTRFENLKGMDAFDYREHTGSSPFFGQRRRVECNCGRVPCVRKPGSEGEDQEWLPPGGAE